MRVRAARVCSVVLLTPPRSSQVIMACGSRAGETKIGPFLVGPKIHRKNNSLVKCISEFYGRKPGCENILTLKVLTVRRHGGSGGTAQDNEDVRSGRLLLHNEYNILGLLSDVPGVVHHHGLFRETSKLLEGGECERVTLALDCCYSLPFGRTGSTGNYINLQQYVIREKRLHERNAAILLYKIAKTVDVLHKVCSVCVCVCVCVGCVCVGCVCVCVGVWVCGVVWCLTCTAW